MTIEVAFYSKRKRNLRFEMIFLRNRGFEGRIVSWFDFQQNTLLCEQGWISQVVKNLSSVVPHILIYKAIS